MKIKIIFVGHALPGWAQEGIKDYHKRIPKPYFIELIGIPLTHRSKSNDYKKLMDKEGQLMLQQVPSDAHCIALDIQGQLLSTENLASHWQAWQTSGRTICLLIGGPEGLAEVCYARSEQRFSLSRLTFPHFFVPLLLMEQLYRAYTISMQHPYHK